MGLTFSLATKKLSNKINTYSNGSLELRKLLLVVLSVSLRVLVEPLGLLLDGRKNSVLVVLRKLAAQTFSIVNLRLEAEDEVYIQ